MCCTILDVPLTAHEAAMWADIAQIVMQIESADRSGRALGVHRMQKSYAVAGIRQALSPLPFTIAKTCATE